MARSRKSAKGGDEGARTLARQEVELAPELLPADQPPDAVERRRVVVRQDRSAAGGPRDVGVDGQADQPGHDGRQDDPRSGQQLASTDPQHEQHDERPDEQGQQVVAQGQSQEQAAEDEVDGRATRLPDQGAVEEQRAQEQVKRIDLGHGGRGPDGPDRSDPKRRGDGQGRPDVEPDGDRGQGRQGRRDEDRRQEVRAEGDRAERDELGQPGHQEIGRVAGRMSHAKHVRDRLHLAPVPERLARQEGPQIDQEGHPGRDRRSQPGQRRGGRPRSGRRHRRMVASSA